MSVKNIVFIVIVAAIAAMFARQEWQNARLARLTSSQGEQIGRLELAGEHSQATIRELTGIIKTDGELVAKVAAKVDGLEAGSRRLDNKLKEALANAPSYKADFSYGPDVTYLFCLRWLSASGRLAADYHGYPAPGADQGAADPVAAFCAAWPDLTADDSLTWLGLLLDHAGKERLYKEALRARFSLGPEDAGGVE